MIYRQQGMIPVSYVLMDNGEPSHKTEGAQQPQFGFLSTVSLFVNVTVVYWSFSIFPRRFLKWTIKQISIIKICPIRMA